MKKELPKQQKSNREAGLKCDIDVITAGNVVVVLNGAVLSQDFLDGCTIVRCDFFQCFALFDLMYDSWKLRAGEAFNNELNLVFTNEIGQHLCSVTVHNHLKTILASIGLGHIRFHDLRHSFAAISLQNGDDIKTVSENLGHATVAFTLDVYGHVTDKMKKDSADRMQAYICGL